MKMKVLVIELSGTDIDQDDLTYIIVTNPEKGLID